MTWFLVLLLLLNAFIGYRSYVILWRSRKLFSDRYAMNIAMSSSILLSLVLSILCSLILPLPFSAAFVISTISGGVVGILFGAMVKLHSVLGGFFGGVVGGLTGSMVGAVILDPTLCGLPAVNSANLVSSSITFGIFGTILTIISFWLIIYSLKV